MGYSYVASVDTLLSFGRKIQVIWVTAPVGWFRGGRVEMSHPNHVDLRHSQAKSQDKLPAPDD